MFGVETFRHVPSGAMKAVPLVKIQRWVDWLADAHGRSCTASPAAARLSRHMPPGLSEVRLPINWTVRSRLYEKTCAGLDRSQFCTIRAVPVSTAAVGVSLPADRHRSLLVAVLYTWMSPPPRLRFLTSNVYVARTHRTVDGQPAAVTGWSAEPCARMSANAGVGPGQARWFAVIQAST